MKLLLQLVLASIILSTIPAAAAPPTTYRVTAPPNDLPIKLDPFYKKYVSVGGFPIVSSEKVSDFALLEAAWVVDRMLKDRPDILAALANNGTRMSIMAADEFTTDIPEHSDLTPAKFFDRRARGLGATPERPAVSCGEENLLRYEGDPYITESILVHEFAHAIHHMGLAETDKTFDDRLEAVYDRAMEQGLWKGKYASTNHAEYWAEGVQSFFDTNRKPDHDHNHVDTREELQEYDPELAKLIAAVFRNTKWRYVRPEKRAGQAHLKGYDPAKAPKFVWPAELDAWYKLHYTKRGRRRPPKQKAGSGESVQRRRECARRRMRTPSSGSKSSPIARSTAAACRRRSGESCEDGTLERLSRRNA